MLLSFAKLPMIANVDFGCQRLCRGLHNPSPQYFHLEVLLAKQYPELYWSPLHQLIDFPIWTSASKHSTEMFVEVHLCTPLSKPPCFVCQSCCQRTWDFTQLPLWLLLLSFLLSHWVTTLGAITKSCLQGCVSLQVLELMIGARKVC